VFGQSRPPSGGSLLGALGTLVLIAVAARVIYEALAPLLPLLLALIAGGALLAYLLRR